MIHNAKSISFIAAAVMFGCGAESDRLSAVTSGGGSDGGGTSTSASGGGGAGGNENGGGGAGGAGEAPTEAPLADGVEIVADTGQPATSLACHGDTLLWIDPGTDALTRLANGSAVPENIYVVPGSGAVSLSADVSSVVVARLGENGHVWTVDVPTGTASNIYSGRVDFASTGQAGPHWYNGQAIMSTNATNITPPSPVAQLAVDYEGPSWIAVDGGVYRANDTGPRRIGSAGNDHYAGTAITYGATIAWGSASGLKILLFSGGDPISFGRDVPAVGKGGGTLAYCSRVGNGYDIAIITESGVRRLSNHATCVSVTRCGDYAYWATAAGNVLRTQSSDD